MQTGLFRRFIRDQRGVFAVTFGLMAIVLVAMAGAVVDYIQVDQTRTRAQIALDSAALALQPDIYTKTEDQLKVTAQALLSERISDPNVTATVDAVDTDTEDGQLFLRAELTVPMSFVSLVGFNQMTTKIISQVTRKKLFIEVAFVLDNSLSMAQSSRMTYLKSAAICATKIIFYGSCNPPAGTAKIPNTKAAIVPFTYFVNIGTGNSGASWIDGTGISSIANDNFDNDDNEKNAYPATVNRLSLFTSMYHEPWAGCVEERPGSLGTNDTEPDASVPDTLFVPAFAPDEPDGYYNSYISDTGGSCGTIPTWVWTQTKYRCSSNASWNIPWNYNNANCPGGTTNTYVVTRADGSTSAGSSTAPATIDGYDDPQVSTDYSGSWDGQGTYTNRKVVTYRYISDRELQERMCKYAGANPSFSGFAKGPNADCPSTALLPLTDNTTTIINTINAMSAEGATNIHEGAIWGFRALSPTAPFTEGRPYNTATSKVMILMTDGENVYWGDNNMNGTRYFTPYGYLWNSPDYERLGKYGTDNSTTMQTKVDAQTVASCQSAKDAGVTVYSIGLSPPNQATRDMLTDCASSPSMAYFPSQPSELNTVFSAIAEQLSQLRIER